MVLNAFFDDGFGGIFVVWVYLSFGFSFSGFCDVFLSCVGFLVIKGVETPFLDIDICVDCCLPKSKFCIIFLLAFLYLCLIFVFYLYLAVSFVL